MLYPFFVLIDYASGIVLQSDTRFLTLYPSLTWLEKNTPKTSLTGNEKTDYGVVASWDYGNWVMFFSKRPVVGAPLGHMKAAREGTRVNSSIFIQSPEESVKLIQERRVRYIVITPQNLEYTWQAAQPLDFNTKRLENFNINTDNTLFTQLLEGAIPNGRPVLRHFRLVHESSPEFKYPGLEDKPYVMIFEYVPGVEVIGKSKPNSFVRVYARLKTKYDRKITYADSTQTDAQGNFTIVLPYGFGHQKYSETELISPYKIQTEEKLINLSVSEEDVLTGKKEEIKE
jgi:dolichyl-diphosphooligosaccharide--protein glycosyltransferase